MNRRRVVHFEGVRPASVNGHHFKLALARVEVEQSVIGASVAVAVDADVAGDAGDGPVPHLGHDETAVGLGLDAVLLDGLAQRRGVQKHLEKGMKTL